MKDEISRAIAVCNASHNKTSSARAYDALLWAVGNNHAGTYTASVLDLLPPVQEVLDHGQPWSRHAALEALIDLYGSFEPELDCLIHDGEDLTSLVRQRIASMRASIEEAASSPGVASLSAQELLELIHETAA